MTKAQDNRFDCSTFNAYLASINLKYGYVHPSEKFVVRSGQCSGCELAYRQENPCSRRVDLADDTTNSQ